MRQTRPHRPQRAALPLLRPLLACALLALLALPVACSSPLSMDAKETDPGIGASLRVVESKTQTLFDELERNAVGPYSDYDAIYYRPLLDELANAQRLARIHDRPDKEREAMDALEASIQRFRRQHQDGKLSFEIVRDAKAELFGELDAVIRMERR